MAFTGALGSWGAALLAPYSDKPDTSGLLMRSPQALSALVKQFQKDNWQVVCHPVCSTSLSVERTLSQNIHCIGDRANKIVLDIFEEIINGNETMDVADWRPRIEHSQVMQISDLERAGRLGGSHLCFFQDIMD